MGLAVQGRVSSQELLEWVPWPWVNIRSDLGLSEEFSPPCLLPSFSGPSEELTSALTLLECDSLWHLQRGTERVGMGSLS